ALRLENTNDAIKYLKLILDIEETDREYQDLCILLNNAERFEDLITWGEKWHKYDPTNVMAVQFVSLGAQRTGNTAIELKYNNILRKLQ
ncbi:MAG: hypothetical protein U1C33_02630, partial [Candidatus Cloacimonadaceae bacterium]|nr:hypothetical protein [Candidatus Cloacimonadaceae bacterium]